MPGEVTSTTIDPAEVAEPHKATPHQLRGSMDDWFEVKRPIPPGPQGDLHARPREDDPPIEPEKKEVAPESKRPPETPPVEPETRRTGVTPAAPGTKEAPPAEEDLSDLGDPEIDKHKLGPHARHETKRQFHNVKKLWDGDRKQLHTISAERDQLRQQLEAAKAAPATQPGQYAQSDKAALDRANVVLRTLDVQNWPTYTEKYSTPIQKKWVQVVQTVADSLGQATRPDIKAWADQLAQIGPDNPELNKEWWKKQLANIDEDDRMEAQSILREIQLLRRERDHFVQEHSGKDKFDAEVQKINETGAVQYKKWCEDSALELFPELKIGEWGKAIDPSTAKDDTDKTRIEDHNKRFQGYERQFMTFMDATANMGMSKDAAKERTRVCMLAVRAIHQENEVEDLRKQLKERDDKIRALDGQLNKAVKTKSSPESRSTASTSKVTNAPNTSTNGSGRSQRDSTKDTMDQFFNEGKYRR